VPVTGLIDQRVDVGLQLMEWIDEGSGCGLRGDGLRLRAARQCKIQNAKCKQRMGRHRGVEGGAPFSPS
jgi:hypothetical protein